MLQWFQRFMIGRYGTEALNRLLSVVSIILLILSYFTIGVLLYPLSVLCLACVFFRMFSRNIWKRSRENQVYLRFKGKLTARFSAAKTQYNQRKTHSFYKCKSCRATLRVPKGKGRMVVTCPKCGVTFMGKT